MTTSNEQRLSTDLGLLVLRLALGAVLIYHGVGKLTQEGGIDKFVGFVSTLGLPGPAEVHAWAAVVAEIGGGALVVLGIVPRIGALMIAGVMVVAMVKVHGQHGFPLVIADTLSNITSKWPTPEPGSPVRIVPNGVEYNVVLLAMSLAIAIAGGGRVSVLGRRTSTAPSDGE